MIEAMDFPLIALFGEKSLWAVSKPLEYDRVGFLF